MRKETVEKTAVTHFSPDTPWHWGCELRGLQGPLLLEKPSQLPPTFLQGRQGEPPSREAQQAGAGLQSPSLEPQPPAWPRHDAEATQAPLRDSSGHLGNTVSHESSVLSSLQHSSLVQCIDISRLSSGYAGDEENSEVSLPGSHQIVRLSRRPHTQAGGAQNSQVCAIYSPKQLKRRLARQAKTTKQSGREHQASNHQSVRVDSHVQSGLQSKTSLPGDKAGDSVNVSGQVAKDEQPAQVHVPL
ncbi:protein TNT [Budorcas taxicolor]|uniref:protein TNT n=1 Tax=Budorcas taxicolor TaxID=37181 RepID=UPI002284C5AB|nr:protein TNT [Budorcas taxicolor]